MIELKSLKIQLLTFVFDSNRYIPIRNATPEAGNEINRLSGDAVYCDQCNVNYCFTCSTAMKKPVEQHRGSTCTENQRSENKDARQHRLYILDEICLLRCPRCKTVLTFQEKS